MEKNKTVNRGWLRRMVEKEKMEGRCTIHLTDDYLADVESDFGRMTWKPARIRVPKWREVGAGIWIVADDDIKPGCLNLDANAFQGDAGAAWREPDGVITLCVHSNLYYEFRLKGG